MAFKVALKRFGIWADFAKSGICIAFSLLGIAILIAVPVFSVQIPLLKAFPVVTGTFGGALGMLFLASAYWINKYRHHKLDASMSPAVQNLIKEAEARMRKDVERERKDKENDDIRLKA